MLYHYKCTAVDCPTDFYFRDKIGKFCPICGAPVYIVTWTGISGIYMQKLQLQSGGTEYISRNRK